MPRAARKVGISMQPDSDALRGVRYEDLLRAIGHYIDTHAITDVVLTQIPEGVLLKGTVIERHGAGVAERVTSILFSPDDIERMVETYRQLRSGHQKR